MAQKIKTIDWQGERRNHLRNGLAYWPSSFGFDISRIELKREQGSRGNASFVWLWQGMGGLWSTKVTNSCFHFISPIPFCSTTELLNCIFLSTIIGQTLDTLLCVSFTKTFAAAAKMSPLGIFAVKVPSTPIFRCPKSYLKCASFDFHDLQNKD